MLKQQKIQCHSLLEMQRAGETIAKQIDFPAVIYLQGDLGSGKTTLCQSIIGALGFQGVVSSPTYNLMQQYPVSILDKQGTDKQGVAYHLDLYRLQEPEELLYLGLADSLDECSLCLVEWPSKAQAYLPKADYIISIEHGDNSVRSVFVEPQAHII